MSSETTKKEAQKRPPKWGRDEEWYAWIMPALKSRRMLKTWLRCCVAVCALLVLMVVPGPSLTMGQASFFAVILAVMLPPNFALSVFIMALTTLFLGMLVGWAWGSAAMAAAHAARSSSLLAQQQQKLQSSLDPNLPIGVQTQSAVWHGLFLDTRSTVVYGVFLFVGTYLLGAIRAFIPNLALLSIFGTIVVDVFCTSAPLLPTTQYTLPKAFIIPACFYAAVAIASIIFIFPESLSHVWLTLFLDEFWTPTLDLFRLQNEALNTSPSDHEKWEDMNARGAVLRTKLIEGVEELVQKIGLIDLDSSLGRLGPADLKKFSTEIKSMMFRAGALHSFQVFVNDANTFNAQDTLSQERSRGDATPTRFQALHRKIRTREAQHGHDLDSLVPILASCSAELRGACESSLTCIMDWFRVCNTRRWSSFVFRSTREQIAERHETVVMALKALEDALEEFRNVQRIKLVKPFEDFFDPVTRKLRHNSDTFATKSLFICFVFVDTLDSFSERLVKLLKTIVEIDSQRPQPRFWFPGRIAKVREDISSVEFRGAGGPFSMGTTEDPTTFNTPSDRSTTDLLQAEKAAIKEAEKDIAEAPKRRDPDAFPPTTAFGRFFVKLAAFFRFFKSAEGIFALRVAIVSVALWIPAVLHSSAWFYYENKGMWALIMAQTGLAIMGFFIRILGTIIGLLLGIVVWYIGAGNGNGNPYGIVIASTAMWTMVSTTILFVVGYSWINANHPSLGSPGVGITLSWKRALLVIIGFAAAFVVMVFPNPISSRVLVRKTLAATIGETGNILAGEIEAFLAEEAKARRGEYDDPLVGTDGGEVGEDKASPKERRVREIGKRVLAVSIRLRELYESLTFARFEPQLAGTWPSEEYERLFDLQARLLGGLIILITSFAKQDTRWCSALVHRTPFMNPNFLSDVFSTLSVLSSALKDGHPLPAYLPTLRDRLLYHEYHAGRRSLYTRVTQSRPPQPRPLSVDLSLSENEKVKDLQSPGSESESEMEVEIRETAGPAKVDGSSMGLEIDELTLDVLMDGQLPAHSTAVMAFSSLITRIDEMTEVVRALCGEATFRGYDSLHQYYLDREERALGGGLHDASGR
ncbi:hypothetical protein NLJ89_g4950 [Agrocybe chaxingu]|uniref:ER transporter 6TM N-terminal domain-containing protein n=1 Tax=Agrocybe chaxingu TaxID=84603 RepID=A0A9W8K1R1_9AGAR|nr:hypothetical protein NLJ89_g4950 [Agrocybe chaxingu]